MRKKQQKISKVYYVKGMHCASCEILMEKEIKKLKDVDDVNVSLKKSCVEVCSLKGEFPNIQTLNESLGDLGYSFSLDEGKEQKLAINDIVKILGVFTLFVIIFYLFETSGIFMKLTVSGNSPLTAYFIFGLVAGLSSCASLVGGLLLSVSQQWNSVYNGNTKKSYLPFLYFNVSRIVAFGLLGGLLGTLGSYISISMGFSTAVSFAVALLMLSIGLQMLNVRFFKGFKLTLPKIISKHIGNENNFKGKYVPLLVGALTFFVPCGFTLIAQTNAVSSGSFFRGALMLMAFSLGTLPVLVLISFSSIKFYSKHAFTKKFNLFAGLLITFFALYNINSQLNVLGLPSLNDVYKLFSQKEEAASLVQISEGYQLMQMEATTFDYYPPVFNIKAGVPTKWEIYNSGAAGCAQAVYARGLYPNVIYLKPGLNTVEFTPKNKGTYKISCSMGMVPPVTVNVY